MVWNLNAVKKFQLWAKGGSQQKRSSPKACSIQMEQWMPAKSKKQQMAAGAALAAKRGERSKASLKGASRQMDSMSEKQLVDFAKTKRKGLPRKKAAG
jgi:hypothetical protein